MKDFVGQFVYYLLFISSLDSFTSSSSSSYKDRRTFSSHLDSRVRFCHFHMNKARAFVSVDHAALKLNHGQVGVVIGYRFARGEAPIFLEVFTEKDVKPGESVSLKCMSTGNPLPQITWKLDGFPLDSMKNVRIGDYVTNENYVISFVNISSVSVEIGGTYSCTASSDISTIENVAPLRVSGPPYVRPMGNLTLVAHRSLSVKCPVGGYPIVNIFWEKNGKRLPNNHRQMLDKNGTLVVSDITKESDEGYYSCTASNDEGVSSSNGFHLTIQVAPKVDQFVLPVDIQMGQRLSISCTVIKGDPPFHIEWLKDGETIREDASSSIAIHHLADYSSTILFKAIKGEHRGNYTCLATNAVGQDSHSQMMVIYAPPQWIYEPGDISSTKGDQVWSNCQASGFPMPSIIWKRAQNGTTSYKTIVSSFRVQILDSGALFIDDIQKSDAGLYLCQASNGVGTELSKVIRISVHEGAYFTSKFRSETFTKLEEAKLSCEAYGEKPITIQWRKDDKPIIFEPKRFVQAKYHEQKVILKDHITTEGIISELAILDVDRRDSALYSCHATNGYGKDETRIQLIVRESPDPPTDIKTSDVKSRSVKVNWAPSFSGNSPIQRYHIYLREYHNEVTFSSHQNRNLTIPNSETSWTINDLVPLTNYTICLTAVNEIGQSEPSQLVKFQTDEEVPNKAPDHLKGYALSSRSIKVAWNSPEARYSFGKINGYYVGYRPVDSGDASVYKTITISDDFRPEITLTNLERKTKYEIVVQAFNSKGPGILSDPILVETYHQDSFCYSINNCCIIDLLILICSFLVSDPPKPPKIESSTVTFTSITLEWIVESDENQITGFIIRASSTKNDVFEKRVTSSQFNHTLHGLFCGTFYEITIRAFNSIGTGDSSEPLRVKTSGSVPIAPVKEMFISYINATSIEVDLTSWKSSGCTIKHFSIKYKTQKEKMWTIVSNMILMGKKTIWIDGLHPQTWYHLKSTAYSDAGSTDAVYSLMTTHFVDKERPLLPLTYNQSYYQVFFELEILLPLVLSLMVVVAVIVLICIMMNKRIPEQALYTNSSNLFLHLLCVSKGSPEITKGGILSKQVDEMGLNEFEKTRTKVIMGPDQSLIAYPSPYASVQINGSNLTEPSLGSTIQSSTSTLKANNTLNNNGCIDQRFIEETPYATVKRTPRHCKADRNVYDYPEQGSDGSEEDPILHNPENHPVSEPNPSDNELTSVDSVTSHDELTNINHFTNETMQDENEGENDEGENDDGDRESDGNEDEDQSDSGMDDEGTIHESDADPNFRSTHIHVDPVHSSAVVESDVFKKALSYLVRILKHSKFFEHIHSPFNGHLYYVCLKQLLINQLNNKQLKMDGRSIFKHGG
uniref:Down syndrome cell adhesion molecule n=1 Tax=Tetranychus urticae TaxID=32264 RepID=T1KS24_TETUR